MSWTTHLATLVLRLDHPARLVETFEAPEAEEDTAGEVLEHGEAQEPRQVLLSPFWTWVPRLLAEHIQAHEKRQVLVLNPRT